MGSPIVPFTWSGPSTLYPAGSLAWSGLTVALQPSGTYFTPNTKPAAEEMNWLLYQISQSLTYLAGAYPYPGIDWQLAVELPVSSSPVVPQYACWDTSQTQWALVSITPTATVQMWLCKDTNPIELAASSGDPVLTWSATGATFGPTSPTQTAICPDPATAGDYYVAAIASAGGTTVYHYNGSTWSSVSVPASFSDSAGDMGNVEMAILNGYAILAIGAGTIGKSQIGSYNGTAWNTPLAPSTAVITWLLKSSGSLVIAMPRNNATNSTYQTSPDGITWTARTMPWTSTSYAVRGLAYSTAASLWFAVVQLAGSSRPVVTWSSPDGITWTQVSTTAGGLPEVSDLNALGTSLVISIYEQTGGGASTQYISVDEGNSWYLNRGFLPSNILSSSAEYTPPRIASSGDQLLAYNGAWVRFSRVTGLYGSSA